MSDYNLPPASQIGENGEFVGLFQVIVVEQLGQRIFVAPNGTELGRVVKDAPVKPDRQPVVPAIQAERVLGHSIRRLGMKHLEADLGGLRAVVSSVAAELERPLQMVDLFGWSGEVALAMFRDYDDRAQDDLIYSVDSFTGEGRDSSIQRAAEIGAGDLREIFKENVRYENIRLIVQEPSAVVQTFEQCQEFDVVFVDTASDFGRMKDQILEWMPHLNPKTGVMIGLNSGQESVQEVLRDVFPTCPIQTDRHSSLWLVGAADYLEAAFPEKQDAAAG